MPSPERETDQQEESKRDRLAALLFVFFPLMIAGGFMLPGFVSAVSDGAKRAQPLPVVVLDTAPRRVELDHQPILVPRNFTQRVGVASMHLEDLFRKDLVDRYAKGDPAKGKGFARSHSDVIVLDDATPQQRQIVEAETPPTQLDLQLDPNDGEWILDEVFDGDTALIDGPMDEDDGPPVVPEPQTGGLVALGTLILAVTGRRKSR